MIFIILNKEMILVIFLVFSLKVNRVWFWEFLDLKVFFLKYCIIVILKKNIF